MGGWATRGPQEINRTNLQPFRVLWGSEGVTSANTTTDSQPDEHLVGALVHDLDTGFVELFQAYRGAVFSTALRISGRWADAEDLTAESFLRAYRALSDYQTDRIRELNLRSWLLTITLNLWRNSLRDAARRPPPTLLDAPDPPDPRADVGRTVAEREALTALLTELPEMQRAAVVLRHVVDLSVNEIAEVLDCPVGTVKSNISRGLRRLRELRPAMAALDLIPPEPAEVRT